MSHKEHDDHSTLTLRQTESLHTTPAKVSTAVVQDTQRQALEQQIASRQTSVYEQLQGAASEWFSQQTLERLPTENRQQLWNRLKAFGLEHGAQYAAIRYRYPTGQEIPGAARYLEIEWPLKDGRTQMVPALIGFVSGVVIPEGEDHGSFGPDKVALKAEQQRLLAAAYLAPQAMVALLERAGSRCGSKGPLSLEDSIDHVLSLVQIGHETALPAEQSFLRALQATNPETRITPLTHRIHSADLQSIFQLLNGLGDTKTIGGMNHGFFFLHPLNAVEKVRSGAQVFLVNNPDTHSSTLILPASSGEQAVQAVTAGMEVALVPDEEKAGRDFAETISTTLKVANQDGTRAELQHALPSAKTR